LAAEFLTRVRSRQLAAAAEVEAAMVVAVVAAAA
jgi:hypothetical protein